MPLKITTMKTYESFWKAAKEADVEAMKDKVPLMLIVKSTNQPDGTVWCRDCGILDKMMTDKLNSMNLNGQIIIAEAGTLEQWTDKSNPFKTDKTLSLIQIPTAYLWKDGKVVKRLECPDLFNPVRFKAFFNS